MRQVKIAKMAMNVPRGEGQGVIGCLMALNLLEKFFLTFLKMSLVFSEAPMIMA